MISRPNVHRRSRRKLTAGAQTPLPLIGVSAEADASTAILTFDSPVAISGPVPLTVESRSFVSQQSTSPTVLVVTFDGATAGMDYALPANAANIRGSSGQGVSGTAGTF